MWSASELCLVFSRLSGSVSFTDEKPIEVLRIALLVSKLFFFWKSKSCYLKASADGDMIELFGSSKFSV